MEVRIDWKKNDNFTAFSVEYSLERFVDTFSMTFNNYAGMSSTKIPVGAVIEIFSQWVLLFRGLAEKKNVSYNQVWSTMDLSWREEILILTETDVDPKIWPFKWKTDNDIMKLLLEGYPRDLSLWEWKTIKEYSIWSRSMRIGQVLEDVAKMNDFVIYKRWNTLYKRPRPENAAWLHKGPKIFLNADDGKFYYSQDRIMSIEITEDITAVRSQVVGYTYTSWKAKAQAKMTLNNTQLQSGSYASRIRNVSWLKGYKINRIWNVLTPAKDAAELWISSLNVLRWGDMTARMIVTLYGISNIELLDVVRVYVEQEKISQEFYVREVVYNFDTSNKTTSRVTLAPFIKLSQ